MQFDGDVTWSLALIDGLKRQRNLRNLCVIVESVPRKRSLWRLPKGEIIEELTKSENAGRILMKDKWPRAFIGDLKFFLNFPAT